MKAFLILLFASILVAMLFVTSWASLDRAIFDAGSELMNHRWFVATLVDAYFGFITFCVWVSYREASWTGRISWIIAILLLGNIAMSVYAICVIAKSGKNDFATLLLNRQDQKRLTASPV